MIGCTDMKKELIETLEQVAKEVGVPASLDWYNNMMIANGIPQGFRFAFYLNKGEWIKLHSLINEVFTNA